VNVGSGNNVPLVSVGKLNLRGLCSVGVQGQYFIADAKNDGTILILRSSCSSPSLQNYLVSPSNLEHPYGLSFDKLLGRVYVSDQNLNTAVYFNTGSTVIRSFASNIPGPRGIVVHQKTGDVFVSSEDSNTIMVFTSSGSQRGTISLKNPIGVVIDETNSLLYATSKSSTSVTCFNLGNWSVKNTYKISGEGHTTGIVLINNMLYVLGQDTQSLYSLSPSTGVSRQLASFDSAPEQLVFDTC